MRDKYTRNNFGYANVIVKANGSSLWKNLDKLWSKFSQLAYWSIGSDANINVWSHC